MSLPDLAACTKVVQAFNPDAVGVSAGNLSAEIDTTGYYEALIILNTGAMGSSATLDVKLTAASSSGGTFADVTDAAFTQRTQSPDLSNTILAGRVLCNGVDNFWKLSNTVVTASCEFGATVYLMPYDTGNSGNTTMDFTV